MKLLAISDEVVDWLYSPAITRRCADVEMVISCGDLPIWYLEFISSALNVPCLLVKGNHDKHEIGERGLITSDASGWLNIDRRRVRECDLALAGLQGCMRYTLDSPYQYEQLEQQLRALTLTPGMALPRLVRGRGLDVLVAHSPPHGIHDGLDRAHVGFTALNWLIATFRPRLMLHGHQHRNYGPKSSGITQVNKTLVVNVHPYRLITISDLEIGVV